MGRYSNANNEQNNQNDEPGEGEEDMEEEEESDREVPNCQVFNALSSRYSWTGRS